MQLFRYNEPMNEDELAFLQKKENRERKQLYKVVRGSMIACFVIPFILAWFNAIDGKADPFSYTDYFLATGFIMFLCGVVIYIVYHNTLKKIQGEIKEGTKTIELTHITRKQYMPQNKTYYFYLNSPTKLSIDVSELDFRRFEEGDELNIEYTTYSKMYLGYF